VIVKLPTSVPLLKSFIPAPTQRVPVIGNVVAAVPVMYQPQRVQMAGAALNAVEQHGALPKAVPTSHLPGGVVGGQVVETVVVTSVTVVVVGLGVVTVVTVVVTSVLVSVVVVTVTVTSVLVVVVVVVVVGVTGQVVMVVVHNSFRMTRRPSCRFCGHVRLINST